MIKASFSGRLFNLIEMNLPPSINFVPKYLSKVRSWHENLPFAYDLISILKPKTFVELGTHYGDSYFTFCQSIVDNQLRLRHLQLIIGWEMSKLVFTMKRFSKE